MTPRTLGEHQELFAELIPLLLQYALARGYKVRLGELERIQKVFGPFGENNPKVNHGARKSLHKLRLAVDVHLFKDKKYLTKTEDHEFLGEFWKSLHPLCEWGGDEGRYDGNHYSIRYAGVW